MGCPIILHVDVCFSHESCFMSVPVVEVLGRPTPFFEVRQCGGHGSFYVVPWVLLLVYLLPQVDPGLLDVWSGLVGPMGEECVQGLDVMENHLVPWVTKFRADLVIDDIL